MIRFLLAILSIASSVLGGTSTVSKGIPVDAPLVFEPMLSSGDSGDFLARGAGYSVALNSAGAILALNPTKSSITIVRLTLQRANPAAQGGGQDLVQSVSHYFVGNDSRRWRTGISNFSTVRYNSVYPGIDVVYHGRQRNLEFDFHVAVGAEPAQIGIAVAGAARLSLNRKGDLVIATSSGDLVQHKPVAYQEIEGRRRTVSVQYTLGRNSSLGFRLGRYDRSRPLVIDPVLSYATFLGGSLTELPAGIALDAAGNIYVMGSTYSSNFPTAGVSRGPSGGITDVFITKFNPTGNLLLYSTYLGSSNSDWGHGLAVDAVGNAYVLGDSTGDDFPTLNPFQRFRAGRSDVFITKLAPDGTLLYSTYFGGPNAEFAGGIAVDSSGIYIAGNAEAGLPVQNAIQATPSPNGPFGAESDAFVTKFNAAGSALIYSTFLGGNRGDGASAIAVDAGGNAYIAGSTNSPDFPVVNAIQPSLGGITDGFVAKISASGGSLLFSTYLGGSGGDYVSSIAADGSGVYITGQTISWNFPVYQALQPTKAVLRITPLALSQSLALRGLRLSIQPISEARQ